MSWLFSPKKSNDSTNTTQSIGSSPSDPSSSAATNDGYEAAATPSSNFDFSSLDATKLHPLAGLNDTLEYLVLEDEALNSLPGSESALPSRGWSDDLCYGTGTTYLSGLGLGGAYGVYEGLSRSSLASATGSQVTNRLRLNYVLNAVTRRGPFLGNSLGVVAILYNGINSSLGAARGRHDVYNAVGAGFVAGALFKCTRGARPALIFGGLAGGAALAWSLAKTGLTRGSPQDVVGHEVSDAASLAMPAQ